MRLPNPRGSGESSKLNVENRRVNTLVLILVLGASSNASQLRAGVAKALHVNFLISEPWTHRMEARVLDARAGSGKKVSEFAEIQNLVPR